MLNERKPTIYAVVVFHAYGSSRPLAVLAEFAVQVDSRSLRSHQRTHGVHGVGGDRRQLELFREDHGSQHAVGGHAPICGAGDAVEIGVKVRAHESINNRVVDLRRNPNSRDLITTK